MDADLPALLRGYRRERGKCRRDSTLEDYEVARVTTDPEHSGGEYRRRRDTPENEDSFLDAVRFRRADLLGPPECEIRQHHHTQSEQEQLDLGLRRGPETSLHCSRRHQDWRRRHVRDRPSNPLSRGRNSRVSHDRIPQNRAGTSREKNRWPNVEEPQLFPQRPKRNLI